MSGSGRRAGSRRYRLLLRLYPRRFRERFGAAMSETFADDLESARLRGRRAAAAMWVRTIVRTPLLALEEHVKEGHASRGRNAVGRGPDARHGRAAGGVLLFILSAWHDVRLAVRALAREPGFALVAIVTIGLGVGATTALFSLTNALLLRPLPVAAPERLVSVQEERTGRVTTGLEGVAIPYDRYQAYEEATRDVFSGLAAHSMRELSLRADGPAFPVSGVVVSGNYFDVLGVRPAAGRPFVADVEAAVVLSHRLWQQRFAGAPDVIGRPLYLNGNVVTVIGIAAPEFTGTIGFMSVDLWVPYRAHEAAGWPDAWLTPFGRLRAGHDRAGALPVVNTVALRIPVEAGTDVNAVRLDPMTTLPTAAIRVVGGFLGMLLATAFMVLLIASANIAGMLLARALSRRREMAVRRALGAGRGRIARQLLTESLVLFLFGGVAGMLIAVWVTRLISQLRLPIFESLMVDASPDMRVLVFAFAVAAGTGIVFGLLPALQSARPAFMSALKDGDRTGSGRGGRARAVFVTAQLAMSVLLLIIATLFVRTLQQATTLAPGFIVDDVVIATTNLAPHGYDEERGRVFYDQLIERVRGLPGVEAAALAQLALLTGDSEGRNGWRVAPDEPAIYSAINTVDGAYFETLGIEVIAGRGIADSDVSGSVPAIVVNQTFAERLWPGVNPVGREVLSGDERYQVVGVTANGMYSSFGEQTTAFAFLAVGQRYVAQRVLHVRMRAGGDPANMIAALRREVAALDPDVALERAMPLAVAVDFLLFPQRFAAVLIGSFGVLGLVLSGLGVYGVLAYNVAQRTREFGIRVALGADARAVLRLVLGRGALFVAIGVTIGLAGAAALTRFLQSLLYGVSALDPVTFVAVPLVLAAVALFASWLPARRAVKVDPMLALRQE